MDLAKLFSQMPGLMVCVDTSLDFRIVGASEGFLRANACRHEALLGHPLLHGCAGMAPVATSLQRVLDSGLPDLVADVAVQLPPVAGRRARQHWEVSCTPLHDEAGSVAWLVLQARDITETMKAEKKLRAQEARTQQILDSASDYAIIATDLDGTITGWNRGAAQVLGWPEAQMLGESLDRIYPVEDVVADIPATERRQASSGPDAPDARWHVRQGGERFWASGKMSTLRDAHGRITGYLKILRDQTERENMARELELKVEALNNFNATLEQRVAQKAAERDRIWQLSNDLMDVCDRQRRLVSVNGAWTTVLGWSQEELLGKDFADFIHADDRPAAAAVLTNSQQSHRAMWFETRVRHRDGHYCTMSWMVSPDQGRFYKVGRDVTHQRETESRLRQSQKMEALGQLTGGIAHDFNNLLATITGSLELVRRKVEVRELEGLGRWTQMAASATQRASALVQRLLAFSRNQSLVLKPVDVAELVCGMEDLLHRTLGENIQVLPELNCRPCFARTDANQLENALLNLAINARDAMDRQGQLRIRVQRVTVTARSPRLDLQPGAYVCMGVSDNGAGMPPEVLARAFDPFFTTKPVGQGTGLGLSMIHGFARQSGGCATIESRAGAGTTVNVYLPQLEDALIVAEASTDNAGTAVRGHENVMLVEDDASLRAVVREALAGLGYTVHEASSAHEALQLLDQGTVCELLVADIGLPGIDGRKLAGMVSRRLPGVQVLFVSGHNHQVAEEDGNEVLTKPFSLESLAVRVRSLLDVRPGP